MKLERLPSVIRNNKFDDRGLVQDETGLFVPVYVASETGFYDQKKLNEFYEKLLKRRILPLCPFTACNEYLDLSKLKGMSGDEIMSFWEKFNETIGVVNYETLMPRSKRFMIALLDGGTDVDSGVAAEVSHYASTPIGTGRVIGIRTDSRTAENVAAPINPAVSYWVKKYGKLIVGPNAYEEGLETALEWSK